MWPGINSTTGEFKGLNLILLDDDVSTDYNITKKKFQHNIVYCIPETHCILRLILPIKCRKLTSILVLDRNFVMGKMRNLWKDNLMHYPIWLLRNLDLTILRLVTRSVYCSKIYTKMEQIKVEDEMIPRNNWTASLSYLHIKIWWIKDSYRYYIYSKFKSLCLDFCKLDRHLIFVYRRC